MQDRSVEFAIPAGLLGAVGAVWGGTPTVVSPLRYETPETVDEPTRATLAELGVCDRAGRLEPSVLPIVEVLGTASAFTRVYLSGSQGPHEYVMYWEPSGRSASLVNLAGTMQVASPVDSTMFVGIIAQSIGVSSYADAAFEAVLTHDEAIVLSVLIDAQRKSFLRALYEGMPLKTSPVDRQRVQQSCRHSDGTGHPLADVVLEMLDSRSLDALVAGTALEALQGRGLARADGAGISLRDDAAYLARRMLVLDSALVLTSGHVGPDGAVNAAGFTCLQAGVHDLLYIEVAEEGVELRSISSAEVLDMVEAFLTDPAVVSRLDAASLPPAVPAPALAAEVSGRQPARAFCTRCGSRLIPGAAFCTVCGAKVE